MIKKVEQGTIEEFAVKDKLEEVCVLESVCDRFIGQCSLLRQHLAQRERMHSWSAIRSKAFENVILAWTKNDVLRCLKLKTFGNLWKPLETFANSILIWTALILELALRLWSAKRWASLRRVHALHQRSERLKRVKLKSAANCRNDVPALAAKYMSRV